MANTIHIFKSNLFRDHYINLNISTHFNIIAFLLDKDIMPPKISTQVLEHKLKYRNRNFYNVVVTKIHLFIFGREDTEFH